MPHYRVTITGTNNFGCQIIFEQQSIKQATVIADKFRDECEVLVASTSQLRVTEIVEGVASKPTGKSKHEDFLDWIKSQMIDAP